MNSSDQKTEEITSLSIGAVKMGEGEPRTIQDLARRELRRQELVLLGGAIVAFLVIVGLSWMHWEWL